jgi:hypothetical protein
MDENHEAIEFNGPAGIKIRTRGYDLIVILVIAGLTLMTYMQYQATAVQDKIFLAIERLTLAQMAGTAATREQTCILTLSQEQRKDPNQSNWCKVISGSNGGKD